MTDLSPAAQAVKDAVLALYVDKNIHQFDWQLDAPTVAAALRAVADQVVPENANAVGDEHDDARHDQWMRIRHKILAIATELEGHQ
jgi:hypothetical protein